MFQRIPAMRQGEERREERREARRLFFQLLCILLCMYLTVVIIILAIIAIYLSAQDDCELLLQYKFRQLVIVLYVFTNALVYKCLLPESWKRCQWIFTVVTIFVFWWYAYVNSGLIQKGGGEVLPGIAYKEYRLTSYHHKLQDRINDPKTWGRIDECLHQHEVCEKMRKHRSELNFKQFQSKPLSSIESGCCKPSNDCNFTYVSPTNWTKITTNPLEQTNSDCDAWNNNLNILCFNCTSCKAGVLDKYKENWISGMLKWTH